jgi:hypothetical protein
MWGEWMFVSIQRYDLQPWSYNPTVCIDVLLIQKMKTALSLRGECIKSKLGTQFALDASET